MGMHHRDKMVIGDIHLRISLYDLEGGLGDLISRLSDIRDRCSEQKLLNARLELVDRKYDDGQELAVVYDRPMSEIELAFKDAEEQRLDYAQRAEYERLKKKFGDK